MSTPQPLESFYAECRRRLDRPQPPDWRMMRAIDTGLQYFLHDSSCATTWTTPLWPLPEGWLEKKDSKGSSFFVHNDNPEPVYEDPRGVYAAQLLEGQGQPVPEHLDVRVDAAGHPFFVDKRTKESYWTDARCPQPSRFEHQRVKTPTPAKPTGEDMIFAQGGPPLLLHAYDQPFQFVSMFVDVNSGARSFKDPRMPQPDGWTTRMDRRAVYFRSKDGTVQWNDPRDPLPPGWRLHLQKDGSRQFFLWITEPHCDAHDCRLNTSTVKFDGRDVDTEGTSGVLPEGPEQNPRICYVKLGPFSEDVRKKVDVQVLHDKTENMYLKQILSRLQNAFTAGKKGITVANKRLPSSASTTTVKQQANIPTSPVPAVKIASTSIPQPSPEKETEAQAPPAPQNRGIPQRLPTFSVRSQSATRERPSKISPVKAGAAVAPEVGGTHRILTKSRISTKPKESDTESGGKVQVLSMHSPSNNNPVDNNTSPSQSSRAVHTNRPSSALSASSLRRQSLPTVHSSQTTVSKSGPVAPQPAMFAPEKGIFEDRWEKVRRLDNGAFGVIWVQHEKGNEETDELYVTKEIPLGKSDHETRQLALNEAKIHSKCSKNPYICRLSAFYLTPKCINMVLDFCPKGSLWDLICHRRAHFDELGYWQEEQVLWWFAQLAVGVEHIHSQGIVHLDIKPANLLLARDWSQRLCDFGLAINLEAQNKIHVQNTFVGTPAYASPEQMQGLKPDQKTDVWAAGVLLFMLCTLQVPFGDIEARGGNVKMSVEEAHQFQTLRKNVLTAPVPAVPAFYSKELRDLLTKLLAKKTRFRPTMRQVLELPILRKHMKNLPY